MALKQDMLRACERVKTLARAFPTTRDSQTLILALHQCANAHGLSFDTPAMPEYHGDTYTVHDACIDFGYSPTQDNLANSVSALLGYDPFAWQKHMHALDKWAKPAIKPAPACTKNVPPPEPPAPKVHRAPTGSLDWATAPAIGCNPMLVAALRQTQEQRATEDERASKRDLIPTFRLVKTTKRAANRVSNPKWHARQGKEVLTLKR